LIKFSWISPVEDTFLNSEVKSPPRTSSYFIIEWRTQSKFTSLRHYCLHQKLFS